MLVSRAACPLVASKAVFCERAGPPSFCRGALSSAVGAVCGEWRVPCYLSLIGFSEWPPFCYGIVVVEDHLPQHYNRRHQAVTAGHKSVASSASTTVLSDAALSPARWRASSCRPKLGGALNTSHPPPRPRASAAPGWPIRRRIWCARAPCQLRRAHARSVRAARARLRQ